MKKVNLIDYLLDLDKRKTKILLFVFSCLIIIDLLIVFPWQVKAIKNYSNKIKELKSNLANFKKEYARMQELTQQGGKDLTANFGRKKIYPVQDLPILLNFLSRLANENSLRIMELKSKKATEAKAKESAKAKKKAKSNISKENFSSFLIEMEIEGGYHSLGKFLAGLQNHDTVFIVEELSLSFNPENMLNQEGKLVLRTYVKP